MKSKIIKYAAIGFACCSILLTVNMTSEATGIDIISEQAIAGITLSLTNYYENSTSNAKVAKTSLDAFTTKEEKETLESEKEEYKNIGIANVDKYLNIREKGDEKASVIGKLPKNGSCYIYSIDDKGWAKIKSGKVTGYVSAEFLITGDAVPELAKKVGSEIATVNSTTVRVREEKNTESTTLTLVPQGEELDVLDDSDPEWVKVSIDNDTGYIFKEYVDIKYQLKKAIAYSDDDSVTTSGGTSQTSSVRSRMVAYAKQFLGNRYVFGGTSLSSGIDCSGFTMRIYEKFGYSISRTSRSQAVKGRSISVSSVKPGDLVFYSKNGSINHVAMYIGGGQVIHASNPKSGVKISYMYYRTPCKAVRFIND